MDADFEIVEGDEEPLFTKALTEEDGTPVDLTGATVVLRIHDIDGQAAAIEITGAADSPETAGVATAAVAGPAAVYNGEFRITNGSDDRTFPPGRPYRIVIRPRV